MSDLFAQIRFRGLLHLAENHGADFFGSLWYDDPSAKNTSEFARRKKTHKFTVLALIPNGDDRFATLLLDGKWPVFHVTLEVVVVHLAANKPLRIKYRVRRIRMECVFRAVSDPCKESAHQRT